ncbi:MAG: phasin family protein [Acidobacteriota bacterium]
MKKDKAMEMQNELRESAHKIWLAGLGALAVAGEEGKALFQTLVERGEEFESRGKTQVEKVTGRVKGTVKDATSNVGMLWERVQGGLDEQVASTLHRLGVPTRNEISTLSRRVEELTKIIDKDKKAPAKRGRKPGTRKASRA